MSKHKQTVLYIEDNAANGLLTEQILQTRLDIHFKEIDRFLKTENSTLVDSTK